MGDLSEYEKKRMENIARNKEVLISLGLEEGNSSLVNKPEARETETRKSRPRQKSQEEDESSASIAPVRKCSRLQGVTVKTYHECDAELDAMEREEARRIKMSQRQSLMPRRFKHEDYERAPRRQKGKDEPAAIATIEFKRLTHEEVMKAAPTFAKDNSFNK